MGVFVSNNYWAGLCVVVVVDAVVRISRVVLVQVVVVGVGPCLGWLIF